MQKSVRLVTGIYLKLTLLTVALGLILRMVLLFNGQTTEVGYSFGEWCQIFLLGVVNDFCVGTLGFGFMWFFLISISRMKYARAWGYGILALLVAAFCYVAFFHTILDDYGTTVPRVVAGVIGYWTISFALRFFVPTIRKHWTTVWLALMISIHVGLIVLNGVGEYLFWNEFGVRYNFIAVDYLLSTNGVVDTIHASYPILPLTLGILVSTLLLVWYLFRRDIIGSDLLYNASWKRIVLPAYLVLVALAIGTLHFTERTQHNENHYVNELQANGFCKLYDAFVENENGE